MENWNCQLVRLPSCKGKPLSVLLLCDTHKHDVEENDLDKLFVLQSNGLELTIELDLWGHLEADYKSLVKFSSLHSRSFYFKLFPKVFLFPLPPPVTIVSFNYFCVLSEEMIRLFW